MGVRLAARYEPPDSFQIEQFDLRCDFRQRTAVDADIDDNRFAAVSETRVNYLTKLGKAERDGHLSLNRNAQWLPIIGVDAGGNVDGYYGQSGGVHESDRLGEQPGNDILA